MTQKQLLAGARQFVEQTYSEVAGRVPPKRAVERAAKEIASALRAVRPDMADRTPKPRRRR